MSGITDPRWWGVLVLAACGGDARARAPATPPTPTPTTTSTPPAAPSVPPLAGDGDHAFVIAGPGLTEVKAGAPVATQVVVPGTISWCNVDARARVVWFVTDDGLAAVDLVDRRVHRVIAGDLRNVEIIVDWGSEKLGGEDALSFDIGLEIALTARPALHDTVGCEGDAAFRCYEDDGTTLRPELIEQQRQARAWKLADPAYVAALAARGHDRALWTPPPAPPAIPRRKPAVRRKDCSEDPTSCGALTAIPASPLWLVQTANSRGDYYHETRELWDPATGEYVVPDGARLVRRKQPPPDGQPSSSYGGLRVSPHGVLSFAGAVFDAGQIYFASVDSNDYTPQSCGWAEGGWRIPGPTG